MSPTDLLRATYRGLRRALRLVSRPVRRDRGLKGVVIQPYRGYGTAEEIFLMGRVFLQPRLGAGLPAGSVVREVAGVLRRLTRWGLGNTPVTAEFCGTRERFETDGDGYFRVVLRPEGEVDRDVCWHHVHLEVTRHGETATTEASVYIPPPAARLLVISDIDDTVMYTGVANRLKMLWRLFVQSAESRVAFPGVAALYRGLHRGAGGEEHNPLLYVSRAPWSIYEVLEAFFRLKRIPEGPVLFLREWGLTFQRPLPRRAEAHKRDLIDAMLARYHDLPVLLIGDSGQHDPEIYADVVARHPGRVAAVYIRDVSEGGRRADEIAELATETERSGTPLLLADDTVTMARHAVEAGFVARSVMEEVAEEREEESDEEEPDEERLSPPR